MQDLLFFIGVFFIALAGIGLLKMPDFLSKMQAVSKASTLGILFIIFGSLLVNQSWEAVLKSAVIAAILLISAPLSTHALAFAFLSLKERNGAVNKDVSDS